MEDGAVTLKINLWIANKKWHAFTTEHDGSPGPLVTSEQSFKTKVTDYFAHNTMKVVQRSATVYRFG